MLHAWGEAILTLENAIGKAHGDFKWYNWVVVKFIRNELVLKFWKLWSHVVVDVRPKP